MHTGNTLHEEVAPHDNFFFIIASGNEPKKVIQNIIKAALIFFF